MGPTSMSPDEIGETKRHQTITRKGSFDSGHRVMNERMKCYNLHGHTYLYELEFSFNSMASIGYAIDFKEIKRVACQWIDDILDHGMLINPEDQHVIDVCEYTGSKKWIMSLNGEGKYCNPTVENIAKELFLAIDCLMNDGNLRLSKVKLYETPNCFTECTINSISEREKNNFYKIRLDDLRFYKLKKGTLNYDDRKL
jgi:6-pyruvoyltetrahydropterin/6-carboxytetrahydropterin synthase